MIGGDKPYRLTVLTALLCALFCAARADAALAVNAQSPNHARDVTAAPIVVEVATTARSAEADLDWLVPESVALSGAPPLTSAALGANVPAAEAPQQAVSELPPGPGSLSLVLTGLLSLGAYQGLRSVRKLHLGALPDWYHANAGPLGHITPLDLEFSTAAMPICVFEWPTLNAKDRPGPLWWLRREPTHLLFSQSILLVADPRGPPASAF